MVPRALRPAVDAALDQFPVVAIVGPRQVGKTTLAHAVAADRHDVHVLDLERPSHAARLADAELYLERHSDDLVVLDEIQRIPDLFAVLRALVDADRRPGRFLVLGSASPELLRQSSESLAGRITFLELGPFSLAEVGSDAVDRLWLRGGFPPSFLASSEEASFAWRRAFITTFVERDLSLLGFNLPSERLRRLWQMLAHRHGALLNASDIARGLGVSVPTVTSYLDILTGAFMLRRLQPYHANLGKRLVRSPKLYVRDSGIAHALLGVSDLDELQGHPVLGASWEGFVIEQVLATRPWDEACFYRTAAGAEIDLLTRHRGAPWRAYEAKYGLDPRPARGFWNGLQDVGTDHAEIIYPGSDTWPLAAKVSVVPVSALALPGAGHAP
jgi:uncharacterized protein